MKLEKISLSGLGNGTWTLISVIFARDRHSQRTWGAGGFPWGLAWHEAGHDSQNQSHHPSQELGSWNGVLGFRLLGECWGLGQQQGGPLALPGPVSSPAKHLLILLCSCSFFFLNESFFPNNPVAT